MSRKKDKEYRSILGDVNEAREADSDIDEFSLTSSAAEQQEEAQDDNGKKIVKQDGEWVWVKIDKDMLCRECGENERDISKGADFPLCKKCAKQQYRYPMNGWVMLLALIMLLSAVFGGIMLPASAENGKAIHEADKSLEQNQLVSAGTAYAELFSKDESNKYVAKRLCEILYRAGNWQTIVKVIDAVYSPAELKQKSNENLAKIRSEVALYNSTNDKLEKMYNELQADVSYDDAIAQLEEKCVSPYSKVCVEYYRYKLAVLYSRPKEDIYSIISQAYNNYPGYDWLLLAPLASAQRQTGRLDEATLNATKLLDGNSESFEAYRQLSVVYLLRGDYESAIGFATHSYMIRKTEEAAHVLLAAYLATGDEEQYNGFIAELATAGIDTDYFVYQLESGEVTIEDIFTKGEE